MTHPPLALNLPEEDAAVPYTTAAMHVAAQRLAAKIGPQLRAAVAPKPLDTRPVEHRIFDLCKRAYTFAPDPPEAEYIRNHAAQVRAMLGGSTTAGDCDDLAVVIAAMLIAHGRPYAFVTLSRDQGPYAHVLCVAGSPSLGWFPIDPQETNAPGDWPETIVRAAIWGPEGTRI